MNNERVSHAAKLSSASAAVLAIIATFAITTHAQAGKEIYGFPATTLPMVA